MLAIEPFAGGHGKIGARYQLVADNLSAHLKLDPKLSKRTVQERFTLLLDEFKQNDQAYRKKTGVAKNYEEHKQLLLDLSDRIRDVKAMKTDEKQKKKDKEDILQTQGAILRELAVKRRSKRDAATEESKQDSSSAPSTESAIVSGSTRDSSSGNYSGTSNRKNSKTAKAAQDGSLAAYLEQQVMSHHEDNALLEQQLKLMKQKGEEEALRWDREFAFKSKKLELAERK
ncbi:hypothetical protein F444_16438 [Phytophthora nicotianae P1976]|uniref:Uncharacterized protein n=1 Tax=Phytophthora nicotianae P1976 TaxID=1317066 RepID=A0A080ZI35_PHYNI|nr:hypothetical protein F444_16438 [Phytophthora nicotianae P1976]